jgi:hypothetical protein
VPPQKGSEVLGCACELPPSCAAAQGEGGGRDVAMQPNTIMGPIAAWERTAAGWGGRRASSVKGGGGGQGAGGRAQGARGGERALGAAVA